MVGIFSKFSRSQARHRRTQSAIDGRGILPTNSDNTVVALVSHGIEASAGFKPVDHPIEPSDDGPIPCPLPEPSILHDGRIWKERVSAATVQRRPELAALKEGEAIESEVSGTKHRSTQPKPLIPSFSAPEHNIINLLDE